MSCCTNTYNLGCFNNCSIIAVGLCLTSGTYNGVFTYGNISTTITVTAIENEPFLFDLSLLNENATFTLVIYDENENQITLTIDSVDYDCFKVKTQVDSVKVTQGTIIGCTPMCKEIYDPNDENTAVLFTVAVDGTTITGDGTVGNPLIAIGGGGGGGIESIVAGDNITIDNTDPLNPIVSASGGGGGSQTLAQTLVIGNETDGTNILLNDEDAVELENGSLLKKGTYDFGGNGGISQICALGYEKNWQSGTDYIFDNSGLIRVAQYKNLAPTVNDDETQMYKVGSIWILDNLSAYICTDATAGSSIWNKITSALFPNGIEFVSASRDFEATDKGKLLILDGEVILTLPEIFPLEENDVIYIMLSGFGSKYQTQYAGNVIEGLNFGNGQPEVVKLGVASLSGNLGFIQLSESAFNKEKTALKYLYDKSQTIPTTTADIADSTDKRYVTDAELTVIDNTSGVNTGDDAVNSLYSGLVSNATHTGEVTGATGLTLDKTAITNKTTVTVANDDYVLISDTSDSGNLKKALKSDFGGGGSSSLSGLTNATTANTINNSAFLQEWQWDSLTSGNGLKLSSSSTGASGNSQSILLIQQTGINASVQTTFSAIISNTKTGATSKSVALKLLNNGAGENLRMQSTTSLVPNYLTYYNSSDTLTAEIGHTNFAAPTFFYINSYLQSIIFKVVNIERFRLGSDGINTSANYINVTSPNFISYSGTGRFYSTNGDEYSFQANNAGSGSSAFFGALSGNRGCLRTIGGQAIIWNNNQQVSINQNTVNASAQFQVDSVTRGVLLPRMTTTQKNAIASPAEGLEVYDSTLKKKCFYNGAAWETITSI